ncbi:hypothetical protein NGRA_1385 [Nosema granulosis]|uniref:Uncharacterized protein n=1 Tax=Nosema granulosis TaxID=83296 RepID=A0A9P6GZ34_9MICR|nr:hypothetical protein NGRA_1385 [Nosema granulosis]
MLVLLYLVSLLASYLHCDVDVFGIYEENFTKKYQALRLSDEYDINSLAIGYLKDIKIRLEECKLSFVNQEIFIYGLVNKDALDEFNSVLNQGLDGNPASTLSFSSASTTFNFEFNPLKIFVYYAFKNVSPVYPSEARSYDYFKGYAEPNTTYLQRNVDTYDVQCITFLERLRDIYQLGRVEGQSGLNLNINFNEFKEKHSELLGSFTKEELNELLQMVCRIILYENDDINIENERNTLLHYIKRVNSKSSDSEQQMFFITSDDCFYLFRVLVDLRAALFGLTDMNLSYFKPETFDDDLITINKAIVFTFEDIPEDVSVICYETERRGLETVQKYTVFDKRVVIFYKDIENQDISFIQVKIGSQKTDLINVSSQVAEALNRQSRSS